MLTSPIAVLSLALAAPSLAQPEATIAPPPAPAAPATADPFADDSSSSDVVETPPSDPVPEIAAEPVPTSSPAPASAPVEASASAPALAPMPRVSSSTTHVDRPADVRDGARDPAVEAFTARRGFRMSTAGTALLAAGVAWTGIAGWMLEKDDPRLGLSLGFIIDGAIATTIGLPLAIAGARRSRNPSAWLDARAGRRARMEAAARGFEPHAATSHAERAVVARGMRLRNFGFLTLASGIGLAAFGSGMQFAYGGDKLAPKIVVPAVSAPFIIAGAALLAAGGRRVYSPHRYVDRGGASASRRPRVELAAAPSLQRGGLGFSLSGKF
jgi:hypothetical protein